ncbi:hypothetical protein [Halodesulfovibrio aestuarii]|uniref:Uncharacterized protein n=1 Tax=Halodesulfovibrio aestuarii TaxID=126333 RepID=A0ABV4JVV6_9BACT
MSNSVVKPSRDDKELKNALQQFLGYIPTESIEQQGVAVYYNMERNGKGCTVEAVMSVTDGERCYV